VLQASSRGWSSTSLPPEPSCAERVDQGVRRAPCAGRGRAALPRGTRSSRSRVPGTACARAPGAECARSATGFRKRPSASRPRGKTRAATEGGLARATTSASERGRAPRGMARARILARSFQEPWDDAGQDGRTRAKLNLRGQPATEWLETGRRSASPRVVLPRGRFASSFRRNSAPRSGVGSAADAGSLACSRA
jgi:hypothetical protein